MAVCDFIALTVKWAAFAAVLRISDHHNIFNVLDKNVHKHKRKIIGRCISEKSMREFEPIMIQHIDTLIKQLAEWSKQEDSTNMTTYFLMNRGDTFLSMVNGLINRRMERGRHSREDFFSLMLDSKNPETCKDTTIKEFTEDVLFIFPADHEPLVIDSHVIPQGTIVGVNIYCIHHNAKYFPDPFTFKPERWLLDEQTNTSEEAKLVMRTISDAFTLFSGGSRGCAGKSDGLHGI
ncbi:cytochrome P450 [Mytilinidion resinicola]|uniref:Cytochrome P450 n=1 Tax=Mytilinidion resinicola TaxID=574789 RepID=A0A6A6Y0M1_9PEZI|nr:cytochrome P450 [Mytilinidion resinicola]KAF2802361.1 cytochrome P450 [Mytilinidion resinicola]